ncbi:restriction endonuclease subunit S [Salmonella enterica]|nr:type II restriction endonuclease subunit R [Salmonella enterica subsp. enterica serovar Kokomlemle]ECU7995239.1 type II restriction endonuclease subunit R [Salmonella enterica subsp. enterica serovar Toucra]EJH2877297.1 restriction endonuclease subunit S [Salmonella enterica]EBU8701355.1 type II restriction endonuclease subunit R [Salmonella enterica subsp. enterica serovar Kokomlemle]EDT5580081.1 type II restriction endonuclease subunit R [Salmonella enterica subsp. enterica serovar Kokomle
MKELEREFVNAGGIFVEKAAVELFDVQSNPQLDKSSFVFTENTENSYPYFTRTVLNNGISGYVEYLDEEHKINGNSIAVGMLGMQFFYMEKDFYAGQFTKTLFPKFDGMNNKIALYFIVAFNKYQKKLQSILVRHFKKQFDEIKLLLPVLGDDIAWGYMVKYIEELEAAHIEELEAAHIEELEAYLIATNLNNYQLTEKDLGVLERYNNIEFSSFPVTELFSVSNTGNILFRDITENSGDIPYLCASRENNSVSSYISYDPSSLEKGNCIFIGGKTFVVTYQEQDFFSNDSHNLLLYINDENERTKFTYLGLITCIYKCLSHKYSWGDSVSNKKIKNDTIWLPVRNKKPDFCYIHDLILVIQKLVIKDVAWYANKKLAAYKQVTEKQGDGT